VVCLTLARQTVRARETAIRVALGASRMRLGREHLAETTLCAVMTSLVAAAGTAVSLGGVVAFAPSDIPRLHEVGVNGRVVSFLLAASLLVTVIGVLLPGLRGGQMSVATALREGAPTAGRRTRRLRRALVAVEIAVTVALLVGAGLLTRSYASLQRVDPGFSLQNLLVLRLAPDVTHYGEARRRNDYYRRVLGALRGLPGVASVGAVTVLPMSPIGSDFYRPYWLPGARPEGNAIAQANVRMATPGYFATLGLPLLSGREFSDRDDPEAPSVVIVNESLAASAWPGQDAVGRTLVLDYQAGPSTRQVVGVVRDAKYRGPRSVPAPEIFIPHAQNPYLVMNVVVRTVVAPEALSNLARAEAIKVDPDQPVHSMTTMERLQGDTLQQDRFAMRFVGLFALGGLLTAATGVYALLAYAVAQRTREIAVRMAIGASSRSVVLSVLAESLGVALVGAAVGALAVMLFGRLARSMLFGIAPQDPPTVAATAIVLLASVLAASWLPARRAARVDPTSAMRP
jgi:putative ABC transport system permease protein